jgi:PPM family protein phosphatase
MGLGLALTNCMHLLSAVASETGRRSNNEDAYVHRPDLGLYCVADGLGGYAGGEVASAITAQAFVDFVEATRRDRECTWPRRQLEQLSYSENLLLNAAELAHRTIVTRRTPRLSHMGSTIIAVLIDGAQLTVAHVGDSRLYRLRHGRCEALTLDHSVFAELHAAGLANSTRAEFAFKNHITRALGLEGPHHADVATHTIAPGDTYLLCSDGVYDPLTDEALATMLQGPHAAICRQLIDQAYALGSSDNMTALVLRAE